MIFDMHSVLHYGKRSSITLDLAADALVAHYGAPSTAPVEDPASAVEAALVDPVEFPALNGALVPGDRVAIALHSGLPCQAQLVAGAVASLLDAGVEPRDITIVRNRDAAGTDEDDLRRCLPDEIRSHIALVTHDPAQRDDLGYLAASAKGDPIYINRVLWEADVVLPIGCLRVESSWDYCGAFGAIYPAFADDATQKRYWAAGNNESVARQEQRQRDADEAGRWLGVNMSIQVIPGHGDTVIHVLAGGVRAVYDRGRRMCEESWQFQLPQRASLVIAGIEGGASAQTWDNVGRALANCRGAVQDDGAILICTELRTRPGDALNQLSQFQDIDEAFRTIHKQSSPDAAIAAELLRALESNQVFLLSDLERDVVEELGIVPIEDDDEIRRLVSRYPSCTIISNAHLARVTVADVPSQNDIEIPSQFD